MLPYLPVWLSHPLSAFKLHLHELGPWFQAWLILMFGLIAGSYATLASYRLPRRLPTAIARSRCLSCGRNLGPVDMFPILTWLVRRGRCGCPQRRHVSLRYPAIEALTATLWLVSWWIGGLTTATLLLCGLATALVIAGVSDAETMILPDSTTFAVATLGLVWRWIYMPDWEAVVWGFCVGGGGALVLRWFSAHHMNQQALGRGDVKLAAAAGIWLGARGLPYLSLIAGLAVVAVALLQRRMNRGEAFPLGPGLAIGTFILAVIASATGPL